MSYLKMTDLDLSGKRVLIRVDLNVPIKKGVITNDKRIQAVLPTIRTAIKANARVMLMSHLGRPKEGVFEEQFSLEPVVRRLSELLEQSVTLVKDWLNGVDVEMGQVVLCENVRFNVGEKANDDELAKKMASLCDVYINDAFATAHRKEASTCGVAKYAPIACAGVLLDGELTVLNKVMKNPERPVVAIVGGSKVSTKLALLGSIIKVVDCLIVGGGIANTFLAAEGHPIGKSLYEPNFIDEAARLIEEAKEKGVDIPLPSDVVVSDQLSDEAEAEVVLADQVADEEKILDVGSETIKAFKKIIKNAKTILWNGPVGVFEFEQFSKGTKELGKAIAESSAYSVAGGGDTIAAIDKYGLTDDISYISTGGGAFLTYLEGKTLPAVEALETNKED